VKIKMAGETHGSRLGEGDPIAETLGLAHLIIFGEEGWIPPSFGCLVVSLGISMSLGDIHGARH
jgi:hypothetical protein